MLWSPINSWNVIHHLQDILYIVFFFFLSYRGLDIINGNQHPAYYTLNSSAELHLYQSHKFQIHQLQLLVFYILNIPWMSGFHTFCAYWCPVIHIIQKIRENITLLNYNFRSRLQNRQHLRISDIAKPMHFKTAMGQWDMPSPVLTLCGVRLSAV